MHKKYIQVLVLIIFTTLSFTNQAALILASDGTEITDLASTNETVLHIDNSGQLLGAFNVQVSIPAYGSWPLINSFDVSFVSGTFADVYNAGADILSMRTDIFGAFWYYSFMDILSQQVLVDVAGYLFDSDPSSVNGCEVSLLCVLINPFVSNSSTLNTTYFGIANAATALGSDQTWLDAQASSLLDDVVAIGTHTYVLWTLTGHRLDFPVQLPDESLPGNPDQPVAVSSPSTWLLMLTALLGLMYRRRLLAA